MSSSWKRARVEQVLDALAGEQLALGVLALDRPLRPGVQGGVAPCLEIGDPFLHGLHAVNLRVSELAREVAASTISSSLTQHEVGGVAERDERVAARRPAANAPVVAALDEPGDHAFADAARMDGSRRRPGRGRLRARARATSSIGSGASQRRSNTRHEMPDSGEAPRHPQRQVQPVGPRHDQHVVALAGRAGRRRSARAPPTSGRVGVRRRPDTVARLVQVARVVERDRLEEHAHRARRRRPPPRSVRSIGAASAGCAGRRDDEPGDVAQHADRVVVVEVAAEALLVAEPGDAHDHRVAVLAVGEELQARRLAAELVLGVVQVGEVLDLRDRQQPGDRRRRARSRGSTARRAACRTRGPAPNLLLQARA